MYIQDLEGKEYLLDGVIEHEHELNGDERIDIDIHYTRNNAAFLSQHDDLKMWLILFDDKQYRIISSNLTTKGDHFFISCTGILYMLDWLNTNRIYTRYDKSLPASKAFDLIFADSPFSYVLVDSAKAESFEGLGDGDNRLDIFKKLLNRYSYEMRIDGDVVYLEARIGHDTNFEYRYQLNAANLKKEVDASAMYTYGIGYADYDDDSGEESVEDKAKIKRTYTSPLAQILGKRHAEPIKDGRIKYESVLDRKIKHNVDESVNISITADIYDLSQHGYDYQHAKVGDRVFLVDERIDLDTEIRVVKINKSVSSDGQILDIEITFGSQPLSDTYQSKFSSAVSNFNELLDGRRTLPFAALDTVSKAMVKNIQSASTELKFDNGIHAVDKNDPNDIVSLTSQGLMISQDGGRTAELAMTARGLVADVITSGTINANYVRILGNRGVHYVEIMNDEISLYGTHTRTWRGKTHTTEAFTRLAKGHLRFRNELEDRSLYFSDLGISTYLDGEGPDGEETSGTLMFFDYYYDRNARGTTLYSTYGNVALKSFNNGIVLDSHKNMYLGTSSEGDVMVTTEVNGDKSNVSYKPIYASYLSNGSSETYKQDIKLWDINATEIIKQLKVYEYKLKSEVANGIDNYRHGVIAERETPDHFLSEDKMSVISYEMISTLLKANQEMIVKIEQLEEQINETK